MFLEAKELLSVYGKLGQVGALQSWCRKPDRQVVHLDGMAGSMPSIVAASCLADSKNTNVFILPDMETSAYFHNDLLNLMPDLKVHFYPSSYKRSVQYSRKSKDNLVRRTETLQKIRETSGRKVIVTFPEALVEKIVSGEYLEKNAFVVHTGDKLSLSFLADFLESCHFQLVDFVYEPGQYSIRGSIIDVFSFSARSPWRIDFFGEEVDSIRSFDIENQLSIEKFDSVSLVPDLNKMHAEEEGREKDMVSLAETLGQNTIWWANDLAWIRDRMDDIVKRTREVNEADEEIEDPGQSKNLVDGKTFTTHLNSRPMIEFGKQVLFPADRKISFNSQSQPPFQKNFEILADDLRDRKEKGYRIYILSDNPKQIERLRAIFGDICPDVKFQAIEGTLHVPHVEDAGSAIAAISAALAESADAVAMPELRAVDELVEQHRGELQV